MVREVCVLSVGQCGNQFGTTLWRQFAAQHDIDCNGGMNSEMDDNTISHYFEQTQIGRYVPRALNVDLEPNVINDIKRSRWGGFFHPDYLIDAPEDAANNFARGHYTVGKENLNKILTKLRGLVERCDHVHSFLMNHAVGGGTGSGLGMLLLEAITTEYRKKLKVSMDVFPSPNISTCIVEPYNTILCSNLLIEYAELSLIFDNEAAYKVCQKHLGLQRPSYANLNKIISKIIAGAALNNDICPFPRLHFMTTSMAPIFPATEKNHTQYSITQLAGKVIDHKQFCVLYPDFDVGTDKYMAAAVNFRGDFDPRSVNQVLAWIKGSGKMCFVDWAPTGLKVDLTAKPLLPLEDDDCGHSETQVFMLGNNVAVNRVTIGRMRHKFDVMYSQRAYVHWYVGEGMEEGEFVEARENLGFLEKDYLEAIAEQDTEDEGGDEW